MSRNGLCTMSSAVSMYYVFGTTFAIGEKSLCFSTFGMLKNFYILQWQFNVKVLASTELLMI